MAGCVAGAGAESRGFVAAGGVGLDFEGADGGVLCSGVSIDLMKFGCEVEGKEVRTRSWRVEEAPCIAAPPATLTFVLGAGEELRELVREPVRTLGRSEIKGPMADGGFLVDELPDTEAVVGSCRASGLSERARTFANTGSLGCLLLPDMYS